MEATVIVAIIGAAGTLLSAVVGATLARRREMARASAKESEWIAALPARQFTRVNVAESSEILAATIAWNDVAHVARLSGVVVRRMTALAYPPECVAAFRTSLHELTSNAFEHGCPKKIEKIEVRIEVTAASVRLRITNPKGAKIKREALLDTRGPRETLPDPTSLRGRGLLLVLRVSDWLSVDNALKRGYAEAGFFRSRVRIVATQVSERTTVLTVSGGVHNSSLQNRLIGEIYSREDDDIVIEFSPDSVRSKSDLDMDPSNWEDDYDVSSETTRVTLEANKRSMGKRVVILVGPEFLQDLMPQSMVARSREEALRKIDEARSGRSSERSSLKA
jgi:two-component sensor histidine kinase